MRNLPTESSSLSLARAPFLVYPCYHTTERLDAISSSRDRLLSRTSSRTTYPRKYVSRLFVPIRQSHGSLLPTLSLSRTRPSREDDGGESSATKRRSFQNGRVSDASVGSLFWPFPLCVSANGNGLPGGDDAGGRASTAHAQPQRPGCAHGLRNNRGGPWDSGAVAARVPPPPKIPSRIIRQFFLSKLIFVIFPRKSQIPINNVVRN